MRHNPEESTFGGTHLSSWASWYHQTAWCRETEHPTRIAFPLFCDAEQPAWLSWLLVDLIGLCVRTLKGPELYVYGTFNVRSWVRCWHQWRKTFHDVVSRAEASGWMVLWQSWPALPRLEKYVHHLMPYRTENRKHNFVPLWTITHRFQ